MLTLDDVHAKEMADIVSHINSNATGKSYLDAILKEADETGEGHGEVLKALWSEASDRAAFYKDQTKNSKYEILFWYCFKFTTFQRVVLTETGGVW